MKTLQDVADAINSGALPGVKGQAWVRDGLVVLAPVLHGDAPRSMSDVFRERLERMDAMTDEQVAKAAEDVARRDDSRAEALIFEGGVVVSPDTMRRLLPLVGGAVAAASAVGDMVPIESIAPSPEGLAMWREDAATYSVADGLVAVDDKLVARAPNPDYVRPSPLSPAAMLGEALELLGRARVLLQQAGDTRADFYAEMAETHARRDAEAREGHEHPLVRRIRDMERFVVETSSCWQCDAKLGTTEACLTCAAKRREGMCIRCHTKPRHHAGAGCADCLNEYMDACPDGCPGFAAWAQVKQREDAAKGGGR